MSGSAIAKVAALASTAPKTAVASRVCRRNRASTQVIVKSPSFVGPATIVSPCSTAISGHDQSVAGLEKDLPGSTSAGRALFEFQGVPLAGRAFQPRDKLFDRTAKYPEP